MAAAIEERIIHPPGSRISLELLAAGPEGADQTLLFLHSLAARARQWESQMLHFGARGYRVLALSMRGHGRSGRPTRPVYGAAQLADDVVRAVEHLRIPALHYIGNSMGGILGYELRRRLPERVLTMTTNGTPPTSAMGARGALAVTGVLRRLVPQIPRPWIDELVVRGACATPEGRAFVREHLAAGVDLDMMLTALGSSAPLDYASALANTKIPFLVLVNEHDRAVNALLRPVLRRARRNPLVTVERLARAGHCGNLDVPQAFNEALERFLRRHR